MSHHYNNDVYIHNDPITNWAMASMAWSTWSRNAREAEAHERTIRKEKQIEEQVYRISQRILTLPTSQVSTADRIRAEVIVEDYEKEVARQKELDRQRRRATICALVLISALILGILAWASKSYTYATSDPKAYYGETSYVAPISETADPTPAATPSPTPVMVRRAQLLNAHPHHHR